MRVEPHDADEAAAFDHPHLAFGHLEDGGQQRFGRVLDEAVAGDGEA